MWRNSGGFPPSPGGPRQPRRSNGGEGRPTEALRHGDIQWPTEQTTVARAKVGEEVGVLKIQGKMGRQP